MTITADAQIVLEGSTLSLLNWVANQDGLPLDITGDFLEKPSFNSAKLLVSALDKVVHVYVTALSPSLDFVGADLLNSVLHTELPSIVAGGWIRSSETLGDDLTVAVAAKLRGWIVDLQASGQVSGSIHIRELRPAAGGQRPEVRPEAVSYLVVAGLDQLSSEQRERSYSNQLAEIQTALGLRPAELARVLGVSREAIRRWFDSAPIAPERWSAIDQLERTVRRLVGYFRAEALPALIRRKIPGLGEKTPLELMYAGREDELLTFYERIFDRGVTQ
jgi:hypothetical protein